MESGLALLHFSIDYSADNCRMKPWPPAYKCYNARPNPYSDYYVAENDLNPTPRGGLLE